MAGRKLPDDAFSLYVALGSGRSYEAVAKNFHVSSRTVLRAAAREEWPKRLEVIEKKTRELTDAKLADELHEMNLRHRKLLIAVEARAAAAIQQYPLQSGMEGVRAAESAIKLERLLAGQAGESNILTIEKITRDEMQRLLTTEPEDDWDEIVGDSEDGAPAEAE